MNDTVNLKDLYGFPPHFEITEREIYENMKTTLHWQNIRLTAGITRIHIKLCDALPIFRLLFGGLIERNQWMIALIDRWEPRESI